MLPRIRIIKLSQYNVYTVYKNKRHMYKDRATAYNGKMSARHKNVHCKTVLVAS